MVEDRSNIKKLKRGIPINGTGLMDQINAINLRPCTSYGLTIMNFTDGGCIEIKTKKYSDNINKDGKL